MVGIVDKLSASLLSHPRIELRANGKSPFRARVVDFAVLKGLSTLLARNLFAGRG
jgi:hypothetical protein